MCESRCKMNGDCTAQSCKDNKDLLFHTLCCAQRTGSSNTMPFASSAPILLVVPAQPQAPSIRFQPMSTSQGGTCFMPTKPMPIPRLKPVHPNKSAKPCAACQVPRCGGLRKRYTPSKDKTEGSKQKMFTFCPTTGKSTTPGFDEVYTSYEHFKQVVDEELTRRRQNELDV